MAPIIIKAASQPRCWAIQGTERGANTAPILAPELKMPVEKDLSFLGKYSAVAFMAAGKLPASPKPNKALDSINPSIETGTAVNPTKPMMPATAVPSGTANA
jgi:hypothetical protein